MAALAGAPGPPGCQGDLGRLLGAARRAYLAMVATAVSSVPFGYRGYLVLSAIGEDRPPTQLELGRRLVIDRTVMTHLLDGLQGAGLVERQVDPRDRRARRVVLTPTGELLQRRAAGRLELAEQALLAPLHPRQRAALSEALALLAEAAGTAVGGEPWPAGAQRRDRRLR